MKEFKIHPRKISSSRTCDNLEVVVLSIGSNPVSRTFTMTTESTDEDIIVLINDWSKIGDNEKTVLVEKFKNIRDIRKEVREARDSKGYW